MDDAGDSVWQNIIPDHLLLEIFSYVGISDLGKVTQACCQWNRVAQDESLWHQLAVEKWGIKGKEKLKASWKDEVKRLIWHVPCECTETIHRHTDEVLDVTFSHSGAMFCTTSRDALVILWTLDQPCKVLDDWNMQTEHQWRLTQLSSFNSNDSRLLVCGSVPDNMQENNQYGPGVGAVFALQAKGQDGIVLVCTHFISLEPPTLFGTWLSDKLVVGGQPYPYMDYITFLSVYNVDGEPVTECPTWQQGKNLFRFTGNRYHLMNLLVAHVTTNVEETKYSCKARASVCNHNNSAVHDSHNSLDTDSIGSESESICSNSNVMDRKTNSDGNFKTPTFERQLSRKRKNINSLDCDEQPPGLCNDECTNIGASDILQYVNTPQFKHYVIFVTGLHDSIHVFEVEQDEIQVLEDDASSQFILGSPRKPTHSFVFEDCYINGINLAKDHSMLFVNLRELDKKHPNNHPLRPGYEEEDVQNRVFCEQIKMRCIDLRSMSVIEGLGFQGHVGYSCFPAWYIYIDASKDYVASCSEDNSVYIWDRHHQVRVANLPHGEIKRTPSDAPTGETTVTNGVEFSPIDQETCISVCDSKMIKVWRSKHRIRTLAHERSTLQNLESECL